MRRSATADYSPLDGKQLRARLATHRIPHRALAKVAGLNECYVSRILNDRHVPGELARIKISDALERLGLDRELPYAR